MPIRIAFAVGSVMLIGWLLLGEPDVELANLDRVSAERQAETKAQLVGVSRPASDLDRARSRPAGGAAKQSSAPGATPRRTARLLVRGRVRCHPGVQPEDIRVSLFRSFDRAARHAQFVPRANPPLVSGALDGRGRYRLAVSCDGLQREGDRAGGTPSKTTLWLVASDEEGPLLVRSVRLPTQCTDQTEATVDVDLSLLRPRTLSCRVVDPERRPLRGAWCVVEDTLPLFRPGGTRVEAQTDHDGVARIRVWEAVDATGASRTDDLRIRWRVHAEGHAQVCSPWTSVAGPESQLVMQVEAVRAHPVLRLRVVDERGRPLPREARLRMSVLRNSGPVMTLEHHQRCALIVGDGGRLELRSLPADVRGVIVEASGYERVHVETDPLRANPVLRLRRLSGGVLVRMLDPAGSPMAPRAIATRGGPDQVAIRWEAVAGSQVTSPVVGSGLRAGRYRLEIYMPGSGVPVVRSVSLDAGEETLLEVQLE